MAQTTTPQIDLFTRLYMDLRSKAVAVNPNYANDFIYPNDDATRDFQLFLTNPQFADLATQAAETYKDYPELAKSIQNDADTSRYMIAVQAQVYGADQMRPSEKIKLRQDVDRTNTLYTKISEGNTDTIDDLVPDDTTYQAYLNEAANPVKQPDFFSGLASIFGGSAEPQPEPVEVAMARVPQPTQTPSELLVANLTTQAPDFTAPTNTNEDFSTNITMPGNDNGFTPLQNQGEHVVQTAEETIPETKPEDVDVLAMFPSAPEEPSIFDLPLEERLDALAAQAGNEPEEAELTASTLAAYAENYVPTDERVAALQDTAENATAVAENNEQPNTPNPLEALGSFIVTPANAATPNDVVTSDMTQQPETTVDLSALSTAAVTVNDLPPLATPESTGIITPEQSALFWNSFNEIKNSIDPNQPFDGNQELLNYIQADERYLPYVNAYLATADLSEGEKTTFRQDAVEAQLESTAFMEQVDAEGKFSTDVQSAALDMYALAEMATPTIEPAPVTADSTVQVASLGDGSAPQEPPIEVTTTPNLAWVEDQLGVESTIAAESDISLSVAALDAAVVPEQLSHEEFVTEQREAEEARLKGESDALAAIEAANTQEATIEEPQATPASITGLVQQAEFPAGLLANNDQDATMGVQGIDNQASVQQGESLWTFSARQLKEMGLENPTATQIQNAVDNISLMNAEQLLMSPAGANLVHEGDTFFVPASLDEMTREVTAQDWEALDENMANYEAGVAELGDPDQAYSASFQKPCVGQTTNLECLGVDFYKGSTGAYSLDDLMNFGKPPAAIADNNNDRRLATVTLGL